jgi:hypothetical protein
MKETDLFPCVGNIKSERKAGQGDGYYIFKHFRLNIIYYLVDIMRNTHKISLGAIRIMIPSTLPTDGNWMVYSGS